MTSVLLFVCLITGVRVLVCVRVVHPSVLSNPFCLCSSFLSRFPRLLSPFIFSPYPLAPSLFSTNYII